MEALITLTSHLGNLPHTPTAILYPTAPTTRTTGELISAAIFNTDLVENIKYFKDAPAFAGNVTVGGTLGVTGATTLSSTVATGALTVTGAATVSTTLGVTGLITSTGGITGGASSHTTGAFSSTVTGGTYNGQTISSAASLTGTLGVAGLLTVSGFGTHNFSAGGTGSNSLRLLLLQKYQFSLLNRLQFQVVLK